MTADAVPGGGSRTYTMHSVEEARAVIAAHYFDLHLDVTGTSEDFLLRLGVAELGALTLGEARYSTEIKVAFGATGVYHVAVPFVGGLDVRQGSDRPVHATPREGVFFDPERHVRVDELTADNHVLSVKIGKPALERQLEILLGRPLSRRPRFEPYIDITRGPGRSWTELAKWSLQDRNMPPGLLDQPLFAGRIEQALLEGLLLATGHQYRGALDETPPAMRPAAVKRVMDAVRDCPAEPYDAARLAAIAQVSLRTLQEAFRRHLGVSPMAYVNDVRLEHARQQLRGAAPGTATVAEVAYRWGFAHLGRFAQRYRARFGESPSQTLRSG